MEQFVNASKSGPRASTPGFLSVSVFEQDETWTDQSGKTWRLRDMEPRHRENLIRYLRRGADHFWFHYGMYDAARIDSHHRVFGVPDDFDIPMAIDHVQNLSDDRSRGTGQRTDGETEALIWLNGTPLMRALVSMVPPERRHLLGRAS